MTAAFGRNAIRIASAVVIALALATMPPSSGRIFASLARHGARDAGVATGWLGVALENFLYAGPLHYGALVAASVAAALVAISLVERRARLHTTENGALAATGLALLCSLDALKTGGGTALLACGAAAMLLLETSSTAGIAGFVALTVLWCNVDAAGLLAPAFAIVWAIGRTLEEAGTPASRAAWIRAALATFATLATPLGTAFPAHALAALQLDGASGDYALWSPADVAPHAYRFGLMVVGGFALAVGLRGRTAREALLGAFAFALALASGAFVAIFGIVAAPIVVGAFIARTPRENESRANASGWHYATAAAALVALTLIVVGPRTMPLASDEPYGALARLARAGATHRVFFSDLAWCDAARADGIAVVADDGIAEAPQAARDAQIAIVRARKTWRAKMLAWHVDAVVARGNSALASLLMQAKWTPFATTGATVILVPPARAS